MAYPMKDNKLSIKVKKIHCEKNKKKQEAIFLATFKRDSAITETENF